MPCRKEISEPHLFMNELRKVINQIDTHERRGEAVPQLRKRAASLYLKLMHLEQQGRLTNEEAERWASVRGDCFIVNLGSNS